MSTEAAAVEVVHGDLGEERAAEVTAFWAAKGALEGETAEERLPTVVCVAVDDEGELVGVNSAAQYVIPLVGRAFWVYRSLLAKHSDDLADAMFNSAFEALAEEFESGGSGPIGVCLAVEDRGTMERRPEAVWPGTELLFAGYMGDGRQLRIRYFGGARIDQGESSSRNVDQTDRGALAAHYSAGEEFRIEPLADSGSVSADDVLALWAGEGVVADEQASRRVDQVSLVAIAGDELAGVSSVYLGRSQRLPMDLWNFRTFVASAHRESHLAAQLYIQNLELLEQRFRNGEDTRGQGILIDLENDQLMTSLNSAVWPLTGTTFIGENPLGAHIRIRYFSGARVPLPGT
jgi:hypothetical protein